MSGTRHVINFAETRVGISNRVTKELVTEKSVVLLDI